MKHTLVLYHANCPDGFASAWACWRMFGEKADYVPVQHGDAPPDVRNRNVLIVDFSYPREIISRMLHEADSLRILDHHVSAMRNLQDLGFATFDMNRSGCGITWDTLHKEERPWIIDYVEDRDLWRHALPDTHEVNAFLTTVPFEFEEWDRLPTMKLSRAVELGRVAWDVKMSYVRHVMKNIRLIPFNGETVLMVNAPTWGISELLHEILQISPDQEYVMGYFRRNDGKWQYSLRSRPNGVDVSLIAKRFGGGGHAAAAGFQVEYLPEELDRLIS